MYQHRSHGRITFKGRANKQKPTNQTQNTCTSQMKRFGNLLFFHALQHFIIEELSISYILGLFLRVLNKEFCTINSAISKLFDPTFIVRNFGVYLKI